MSTTYQLSYAPSRRQLCDWFFIRCWIATSCWATSFFPSHSRFFNTAPRRSDTPATRNHPTTACGCSSRTTAAPGCTHCSSSSIKYACTLDCEHFSRFSVSVSHVWFCVCSISTTRRLRRASSRHWCGSPSTRLPRRCTAVESLRTRATRQAAHSS